MKGALGSVLLTDLYQLTMLDAYRQTGMNGTAVFEMFVRRLPASRGFLMAAGLEQALDYLESLRFEETELEWLAGCGHFDREFVDWLADLRFEGEVWAMREGEVFFANEPMLRVEAPITQAQLVESRLINILHFQSLIATKAARVVMVAGGRTLVDFGMRRAHGAEAGLMAARASYIAGFAGSATVLADMLWGVPSFGTMNAPVRGWSWPMKILGLADACWPNGCCRRLASSEPETRHQLDQRRFRQRFAIWRRNEYAATLGKPQPVQGRFRRDAR